MNIEKNRAALRRPRKLAARPGGRLERCLLMCGIVGYVGARCAQNVLLDGLTKLEYRGYDSAGLALSVGGGIRVIKSKGRLTALRARLEEATAAGLPAAHCGIGHTRWATHGEPSDVNSHPHSTPYVSIVHNGIIENYGALKAVLEAKGYTFVSETDTEVLVKLIDSCYYGEPLRALTQALARVRGSYALAVLFRDWPDTLFAVRRESPLIVGYGEGENFLASDIPAILRYTRRYSVLEEGDMVVCKAGSVQIYDEFGRAVQREKLTADWDIEAAEKGGYPHFMLKEINEQPAAITATVSPRVEDGLPDLRIPELNDQRLASIKRVHLVACGTAMHAGMVGKYVIESLCRVPVEVDLASELRYRDPIVGEDTLLIVVSQSGETADTIAALRECKARGAYVLAIVNVVGSTIARLADCALYTHAGPEIAVATTKGYTTQLSALYLFAVWAAEKLGRIDEMRYNELVAELSALPARIQRAIDLNLHVKYLAGRWHAQRAMFFIGRNIDYAAALEGSLKLKEISYIHSEAYAAGELKHGTIALIDEGRLVVALCCQTALFEKMVGNIQEVKARGAKVLGLAPEGDRRIFAEADDVLFAPGGEPLFAAAPEIVPLQLFAYYVARENGCDIDKPRNLAKSVTVE